MGRALNLAFFCSSGSPTGIIPHDIYTRGVGGAELALVSLTESLAQRGHNVTVYNDPQVPGAYWDPNCVPPTWMVHYKPLSWLDKRGIDAFVLYRTPWVGIHLLECPIVFWSCDQQTAGDYRRDIFPFVRHTVTISPYHTQYHIRRYGADPEKIGHIDLGVRLQDYVEPVEKVPYRCIYCSVPGRGVDILAQAWPLIKDEVPQASLVITGDYTLWGAPYAGDETYRLFFQHLPDVNYRGAIPRRELCREQLKAQVMSYPGDYEELFCIAVAECQVAGAVPVTSTQGALPTTVEVGVTIPFPPRSGDFLSAFVRETVSLLTNPQRLAPLQEQARATRERFDWNQIAQQWEDLISSLQ